MNNASSDTSNQRSKKTADPQGPDVDEDQELVERSVSGDATAFETLFVRYRQRLFGAAWRVLKDEDAALDVVQDAFVKAYQRLESLRGEGRFYPWLRRIAVNLAIDRLRHKKRGVEVGFDESLYGKGDGADAEKSAADPDDRARRENPARQAELSEFSGALDGALEKLSDAHRTTFMLHAGEGMTYKEIAEAMNCNIGTVMSRLYYARKKLQELLAPHLEGEG